MNLSRVPGSGVRGRGSGERETTASSLAGKTEARERRTTVVKERMDLLELLRKGGMDGDVDFLREALRVLVEGIMDAEVSSRIGAEYGERSAERVTQRKRVSVPGVGYPCRDDGSAHPEAQRRELLPEPAGATASQRASSAGCDPAGLRGRCIDKAGGRSGQGPGM